MRKLLLLLTCLLMCCCSALALAADKTKAADDPDTIKPMETISAAEMNERLQVGNSEDLLYVKIKEDRVEVYQGLATDRSLRKQLILTMPNTEMLRLYTNNKATFAQMNKMLSDYESSNANFNGYKIITDKDTPKKLENGGKIYRLWFMKIEREKQSRRGGWNFPNRYRHRRTPPPRSLDWSRVVKNIPYIMKKSTGICPCFFDVCKAIAFYLYQYIAT